MNRKNHLLAILAAVSLILASLAGCGGKTEPDVPQPTQKPVEYANLTDEDSRVDMRKPDVENPATHTLAPTPQVNLKHYENQTVS